MLIGRQVFFQKTGVDSSSTSHNKRVSNLIGKGFSCRGNRCRIEPGLTRLNILISIIV